jgi:hypothetical protein
MSCSAATMVRPASFDHAGRSIPPAAHDGDLNAAEPKTAISGRAHTPIIADDTVRYRRSLASRWNRKVAIDAHGHDLGRQGGLGGPSSDDRAGAIGVVLGRRVRLARLARKDAAGRIPLSTCRNWIGRSLLRTMVYASTRAPRTVGSARSVSKMVLSERSAMIGRVGLCRAAARRRSGPGPHTRLLP